MGFPRANKINAEKYVAGLSLFKQKVAKVNRGAKLSHQSSHRCRMLNTQIAKNKEGHNKYREEDFTSPPFITDRFYRRLIEPGQYHRQRNRTCHHNQSPKLRIKPEQRESRSTKH